MTAAVSIDCSCTFVHAYERLEQLLFQLRVVDICGYVGYHNLHALENLPTLVEM
jgi:hypothetical protein